MTTPLLTRAALDHRGQFNIGTFPKNKEEDVPYIYQINDTSLLLALDTFFNIHVSGQILLGNPFSPWIEHGPRASILTKPEPKPSEIKTIHR